LASDRLASIDDPEVKRTMPRLLNAIDRAVNLCSQTLNYVGDSKVRLDLTRFYLKDLLQEVEAAVQSNAVLGAAFSWQNKIDDMLEIEADREQLFRAISNLGQNAIEAGAEKVLVRCMLDGGWVIIDIADDGPGLAASALENLFQPFAGSARDGGTGLGLVIVRDVVRAHGGDVSLVNPEINGETGGATFRLRLPQERESDR